MQHLILALDPGAHFPAPAVEHLRKIPVVMLDSEENCTSEVADVVIPGGCCRDLSGRGQHTGWTMCPCA